MKTYSHPPDARDAEVIAKATGYVVVGFRGRGQFAREQHATLDEARQGAAQLATNLRRPVAIYAILNERQAHIENAEPQEIATHGPRQIHS